MVPFLYFFYARPGWSGVAPAPEVATVAAHATSLLVILPTAVRGALSYHRRGGVEWRAVWPVGVAAALSAAAASRLVAAVDPRGLRLVFAAFLLWNAVHLLRPPREGRAVPERKPRLTLPATLGTGAAVGVFSALLGVGGGLVSIPLLLHGVRVGVRRVAGTSLAIIALTSLGGALSYMLAAPAHPVRPGWSAGYVDLLVALVLAGGTVLSVGWGAELNRRMNPRTLSKVFAAVFALLAAQLVVQNV